MADFMENVRKLRAVAQASADKLRMRETGTASAPFEAANSKRPRRDWPDGAGEFAPPVIPGPPPGPPPFSVIKVPDQLVGLLIGKGGQGLKHLEQENFVKVTVGKLVEGGHRRVCIEGDPGCQAKAIEMIEHFVTMKEAQDAAKQVMTQQVTCSEILQIPERFVGLLIGKGGENIKRVRQQFNINSHFEKDTAPGEVRVLTLRGTAEAVAAGKEQVEMMLLQFNRKDGIFHQALEEKYGQLSGAPRLPPPPAQLAPGIGFSGLEAMRPQVPFMQPPAFAMPMDAAQLDPGRSLGVAAQGPADAMMPETSSAMPPWAAQMPVAFPPPPANDHAAAAQWAARYEEVLPWAIHYANDETCVNYYLQLREAAAAAASSIAEQYPQMGMA